MPVRPVLSLLPPRISVLTSNWLMRRMAADGIELARRACGGHGFSMFSGLVHFYQDYRTAFLLQH